MRLRRLSSVLLAAILLMWPVGGAHAKKEVYRDDRFIIIDEGEHGDTRIAYVRDELYRGLEALGHLGVAVDKAPYPITVRVRPGSGVSHINRQGEIILHRVARNRSAILHELTHVVAGYNRPSGHWSQEGFASFVQDQFGSNNSYPTYKRPDELVRIILSNDDLLPMDEVMADRRRRKYFAILREPWLGWHAYTQSSSFVSYLIGKYGTTPFHAIYNKAVEDMDFDAAYGLSKDQLIADWLASVRQRAAPTDQARRLYNMLNSNLNK